MISQIFKSHVDKIILINLLDKIAYKHDTKYIFDNDCYKRAVMLNVLDEFINEIRPYYHKSKQHYIDKKKSYKMLSTVIRQICRLNGIFYKQQIVYSKSTYEIKYHIYNENNAILVDVIKK